MLMPQSDAVIDRNQCNYSKKIRPMNFYNLKPSGFHQIGLVWKRVRRILRNITLSPLHVLLATTALRASAARSGSEGGNTP